MLPKSRYKSHNPIPSHNFDGRERWKYKLNNFQGKAAESIILTKNYGIYDLVKSVNLLQYGRHDDVFNLLTVIVLNRE